MTTPVAINPLQWLLDTTAMKFNLDEPTLRRAFSEVAAVGFTAVQSDVPEGMDGTAYLQLLAEYGLSPAPGYFGRVLTEEPIGDLVEAARRHAGLMAELGLASTFIADNPSAARLARPAVGAQPDTDRTLRIAQTLNTLGHAMSKEGIKPALHPHVGTWIESEEEIDVVLGATDPTVLGFGPDIGHLTWAGIDPVGMIGRHAGRITGLHIKDVSHAVRDATKADGADYVAATTQNKLWREPGTGDVDIAGALAAAGEFDGWSVIEVDVPAAPTPIESATAAAAWLDSQPRFAGWRAPHATSRSTEAVARES